MEYVKVRSLGRELRATVLLVTLSALPAGAATVGKGSFLLEIQGTPTDYTACTLATFENASYDVFGTMVNLSSDAGSIFCIGEVVGGVSSGIECQSATPGAFDLAAAPAVVCNPESCLGDFSFATVNVSSVTGTLPTAIGPAAYTFDGYGSFLAFGAPTIPGCPVIGSGPRYLGTLGINAFQSVATVPGDNEVTAQATFLNPVTGVEVPITVGVQFGNVDAAGTTTVSAIANVAGTLPSNFAAAVGGFQVSYLDVVTTAEYTPPITICTNYEDADDDGIVDGTTIPESALSFLHQESGVFVDRTSSRDAVANQICATVDSLSFFAVLVRTSGICESIGEACDDGDVCTTGDVCDSNLECVGSGALACDDGSLCTEDTCVSPSGCVHLPPTSPVCVAASKSSLKLNRADDPAKGSLAFGWQGGPAMTQAELGDPATAGGDDYRLCVYDGDGLLYEAQLPAATMCGDKPCWAAMSDKGFKYKDKAGSSDGAIAAQLKTSPKDGKNKVQVKSKGAQMSFAQAAGQLSLPVSARVVHADSDLCFEGVYATADTIKKNDGVKFSGKQQVD